MYRYMIEHPDWLPQKGKDELRPFFRAGEHCGRIYRVFPTEHPPQRIPRLDQLSDGELVARLESGNGVVRDMVQKLLVERASEWDAVPPELSRQLQRMAYEHVSPLSRLQALAVLDGIGQLQPSHVIRGLGDADFGVRRHCLVLAEKFQDNDEVLAAVVERVADRHAKVRLQLACSLGEWKSPKAGKALVDLVNRSDSDSFMAAAILSSAVPHYASLTSGVSLDTKRGDVGLVDDLLKMSPANRTAASVLLQRIQSNIGSNADVLNHLANWLEYLERTGVSVAALQNVDDDLTAQLKRLPEAYDLARGVFDDGQASEIKRAAATRLLGRQPVQQDADWDRLKGALANQAGDQIERHAIQRLGATISEKPNSYLLDSWQVLTPAQRLLAIDRLSDQAVGARLILTAIVDRKIDRLELDTARRNRLLKHRLPDISNLAKKTLPTPESKDRAQAIRARKAALSLPADLKRGELVFQKNCRSCHLPNDVGNQLGPNLRSVTDRTPTALLTSILDPSVVVEPKYLGYQIELASGKSISGLIAGESGNSLLVKLLDGTEQRLLMSDIESINSSGKSFMPEGLEVNMSDQDLADVIHFVRSLR